MLKVNSPYFRSSSTFLTSLKEETPSALIDSAFLDSEKSLETSFYFGKKQTEIVFSKRPIKKPIPKLLIDKNDPVTKVTRELFCKEPFCEYNLNENLIPEGAGFCICQQQFCQKHFYSHKCPYPKENEIVEIFKETAPRVSPLNPDNFSPLLDRQTRSSVSSSNNADNTSSKTSTIKGPDPFNFDSDSDFIPPLVTTEELLKNFRQSRNLPNTTKLQQKFTFPELNPRKKEEILYKDLINKIKNMKKSVDAIRFLNAKRINPNLQQTDPIYTSPQLPNPILQLSSYSSEREKTISYQEKLEITYNRLLEEFHFQEKIFKESNKENRQTPTDQEN